MPGLDSEAKEAFAVVNSALSEWDCSYEYSLREVDAEEKDSREFLSTWSKVGGTAARRLDGAR